jgi:hypothetical protein
LGLERIGWKFLLPPGAAGTESGEVSGDASGAEPGAVRAIALATLRMHGTTTPSMSQPNEMSTTIPAERKLQLVIARLHVMAARFRRLATRDELLGVVAPPPHRRSKEEQGLSRPGQSYGYDQAHKQELATPSWDDHSA